MPDFEIWPVIERCSGRIENAKMIHTNRKGIWESEGRPMVPAFLTSALDGGRGQLYASASLPRGK